jgi:hypothetical protein
MRYNVSSEMPPAAKVLREADRDSGPNKVMHSRELSIRLLLCQYGLFSIATSDTARQCIWHEQQWHYRGVDVENWRLQLMSQTR